MATVHRINQGPWVNGFGPAPSDLMILGERPGREESQRGIPFVGKSGQEQERYLHRAGIPTHDDAFYKTNVVKDYLEDDPDPEPWEIKRDIPKLVRELREVKPRIIATIGRFATRLLVPGAQMEWAHGMSYHVTWGGWTGWVVPVYHPAAGLYNHDLQPVIQYDYKKLGAFVKGKLELHHAVDEHPEPDYTELQTPSDLLLALGPWDGQPIGMDTEGSRANPWGLSFCFQPGTAYVIRHPNPVLLELLDSWIQRHDPLVILHSALHDIEVLRAMGVRVPKYEDTMVMAYQLQVEPQGLKPLLRRYCGMAQASYQETVQPANDQLAIDYITNLWQESRWPDSKARTIFDKGQLRFTKPWSLNRKLAGLMKSYLNGDITPKDLRERWTKKWDTRDTLQAIEEFGDMPVATLDMIPDQDAVYYSARDADGTARLYPHLKALTDSMGLQDSLDSDHAVIPIIEDMQATGLAVDVPQFQEVSDHLLAEMLTIHAETENTLGTFVNLNSSKQLAELFYESPILKSGGVVPRPPKLTDTGQPSLNEAGLRALHLEMTNGPPTPERLLALDIIDQTLDYRELLKLRNTYAEKIPLFVRSEDARLHPNFRLTKVITGRLAAFDPNVLAIPTRSELAKLIKQCFVAPPGRLLGTWDLSNIEMRVMAHLSQDPIMLENFHNGIDQHTRTASMIWGIPMDQVDKATQRFPAKTMGFLIIYGGQEFTLRANLRSQGLDWSLDRCKELINLYLDIHSGVRDYMKRAIQQARTTGVARTVKGRIRHLPGLYSNEEFVRLEAERAAINHPIQGTAQEIIKAAMADLWEYLQSNPDLDWKPLLQIHDELMMEFPDGEWDLINTVMVYIMENCWELDVPIVAGGDCGRSWAELDK